MELAEAKQRLLNDELLSYPTETLFGLAANPFSDIAVKKLFNFKQRPIGEGVTLILDKAERVELLGLIETSEIKEARIRLQKKYWPGPLTLVVKVNEEQFPLCKDLLGPNQTIGIRVSSLPVARQLASVCDGFVTATSANKRGEPAAKTFEQAIKFIPNIPAVEGECLDSEIASTIVDVSTLPHVVLREGAIQTACLSV